MDNWNKGKFIAIGLSVSCILYVVKDFPEPKEAMRMLVKWIREDKERTKAFLTLWNDGSRTLLDLLGKKNLKSFYK